MIFNTIQIVSEHQTVAIDNIYILIELLESELTHSVVKVLSIKSFK